MLVVCLCAEWCGVCRDYLECFDTLRARFPQVRFAWVDVEDQSDLVDPLEVGLPVVVWAGPTTRSRHALAMLRAANLEDMVSYDRASYVARAVALGLDATLRQTARARRRAAARAAARAIALCLRARSST